MLDQSRSPLCSWHSIATCSSSVLYAKYGLFWEPQRILDRILDSGVRGPASPDVAAADIGVLRLDKGGRQYFIQILAQRFKSWADACAAVRKAAGVRHVCVGATIPENGEKHCMTAIRHNVMHDSLWCLNSWGVDNAPKRVVTIGGANGTCEVIACFYVDVRVVDVQAWRGALDTGSHTHLPKPVICPVWRVEVHTSAASGCFVPGDPKARYTIITCYVTLSLYHSKC